MSAAPLATYLDRVDAHLATLADHGDQAVFLQRCLDQTEANGRRLSDWAAAADGTPCPRGLEGVSILDIADTLAELTLRLDAVRERIRARIATAEQALPPKPNLYLADEGRWL